MDLLKRFPATLILILLNCITFGMSYLQIGSFDEPRWTLGLLQQGAEFNPYTLGGEWYRVFTHMFLHAHILHLAVNMYALFSVGREIELVAGTKKFLVVYLLGGVASALSSLYWSLFTIGVGASGAIFGLFGFSLAVNILLRRAQGQSIMPVLFNFLVFLGINLLFAEALHADNAAHMGGLACGLLLGLSAVVLKDPFEKIKIEYALLPAFVVVFFFLPRYQLTYFQFFQKVLATEDSTRNVLNSSLPDRDFLSAYEKANAGWDTALAMLNRHTYLPQELQEDTATLRNYISLRKNEGRFRLTMVDRESYIYLDSIEWVQGALEEVPPLKHVLDMKYEPPDTTARAGEKSNLVLTRVWYDSNWVEIPYPPAVYSRLGNRDSIGRWQGPLRDYFKTGDVQMKGTYKNDLRHGVFIYYSDHKTYEAAGRYQDDRRVGKWETFHPNGRPESEVYYRDRYFLKNYWDSAGVQMVSDGRGKEVHRYPNGTIAVEGQYVDGYQHGYWYGRHKNGQIYFEEHFHRGRLVNGRSLSLDGKAFFYDEGTLYPIPRRGYRDLNEYLRKRAKEVDSPLRGVVKISFRVTVKSQLTEFKVEQSLDTELDEKAKEIIRDGPSWLPAKIHGQEPTDGYAVVSVEF